MDNESTKQRLALEDAGFFTTGTALDGSFDNGWFSMKSPVKNRVDDLANELFRAGRTSELEGELKRFNPGELSGAERESWYHLWGVVAFRRGDRIASMQRFAAARRACPESGLIAFSLGQEFEYVGQIDQAIDLFDFALFPKVSAQYALAQARYAYLWNRLDKALQYTLPILDAYYDLKIADDNFVYMRGLPFFTQTWKYLAAVCELTGDLESLRRLTEEAAGRLSDFDFEPLKLYVDAIERNDFKEVLTNNRQSLERHAKDGFPSGYISMQVAVLESQQATDQAAAEAVLAAVQVSPKDFPWLNDIRLLGQCEVAHRFTDSDRERRLQDDFVKRQPLLFEPDHAFVFRLLSYQEFLKPHYWKKRRQLSSSK